MQVMFYVRNLKLKLDESDVSKVIPRSIVLKKSLSDFNDNYLFILCDLYYY